MSFISLLFGRRETGAVIGGLSLDATLSENHERSSDITESPVETGATITDHVILNPERVTIEGFVTDAPAVLLGGIQGRGVTQNAFDRIEELWRNREPFDIDTGYKRYVDMVIADAQLPRERDGSMTFTIEAQKVTIVDSERRQVPEGTAAEDVDDLATSTNNAGRQTSRTAGEATAERGSVLSNIFGVP